MLTNSERSRAQVRVERLQGYSSKPQNFQSKPAKEDFKLFKLPHSEVQKLKQDLLEDGRDLFFKGALSFYQGIFDIHHGLYSWSVTKFYYAIFYFLKSSLAMRGVSVIRCKSLYTLECNAGATPIIRNGKGDHQIIIKIWKAMVTENNDILLGNTINKIDTYTWMMGAREAIQYKSKKYSEPRIESYLSNLPFAELNKYFQLYSSDSNAIRCFDPEHACLAIPLKRFLLSYDDLLKENMDLTLNEKLVLHELVRPYFSPRSVVIKPLIN